MGKQERVVTQNPLQSLWIWLSLLASKEGAEEVLRTRAGALGLVPDQALVSDKADGISYCVRSASECFRIEPVGNTTSASVAFYYGTLSLLEAILLSDCSNELRLSDVEHLTERGHGISCYPVPAEQFPTSEKIALIPGGFLAQYTERTGMGWSQLLISSKKKKSPKRTEDVEEQDRGKIIALPEILGRIPEITDLYTSMYGGTSFCHKAEAHSAQYNSVMAHTCNVDPLRGTTGEDVLVYYLIVLYCLSIWSRYRPSIWRALHGGSLDRYSALVTALLVAAQRIVPNLFLDRISGHQVLFAPHSYWG